MLVVVDGKALEWVGIVWFSKDPVGYEEINAEVDQHTLNQEAFMLPDRILAKKFVFRLIYGGTEFSYARDADFTHVSSDEKFWREVIEKFYDKYRGIASQHTRWVQEATRNGFLEMPTGRRYDFKPIGGQWPRTQILNYPVQGLGHDLMTILRVLVRKELQKRELSDCLLVSTVHDSIYVDTPSRRVDDVCEVIKASLAAVPSKFEQLFGVPFDLPFRGEMKVGMNMLDMEKV